MLPLPLSSRCRPTRSLLAPCNDFSLPHLAEFGRSFHQSLLPMFAIFMRCRLIRERVDHDTGHSGGVFSAASGPSGSRRYSGMVQSKFREEGELHRSG